MRTPSGAPLAAMAALMLLAASSACAPRPVDCPPPRDRFDDVRGFTRERHGEVHPAMAAAVATAAAVGVLAGARCR